MNEQFSRFRTEEGLTHGLAFQPKSTDIIISPYAKSGTTWIQQIVHGLRTRGSMDFEEIIQVIPWIEMAFDVGIELESTQVAEPRAFKSHLTWDKVPKGARYIYAVRDPKNVLVSLYRFFEGWVFESGSITISDFAEERFCQGTLSGSYWDHVGSWWEQRENPNVLILCFEDMKTDLPKTVRRIAQFIDCDLDEELLDIVLRQSSLEFMVAHKEQFNEHLLREIRDPVCGYPRGGESSKVTMGNTNSQKYELSERIKQKLDEIWHEEIGLKFGLASYEAFREELARLDLKTSRIDR
ncbi:MAG: sulfotransferase domain-containing protein [Candidatus Competibacteraceae bacterium]|nr:sulfotransferase domain-containing protein [Candidatus Competibacteraceae bacterium]